MKKIDTVIEHLVSNPIYSKLQTQKCFQLIVKALPEPMRRGVLFVYVKNETLFFALKHPAFKMEFDYKLTLIKNLLTTLPPLQEACAPYRIRHVKAFVSRFATPQRPPIDTEPRYKERATPQFVFHTEEARLVETFEAIQKAIANNRNR